MAERRLPWVRILVEGAVIVVSILLAFALDAWWDARRERVELLEDLASVTEEVRSNLDVLALESRFHGTAVSSIDDLLARIDAAEDGVWLTLPDTIASFAIVFPPLVDPSTGALDALVAGGGLSRIRDRRLQRILGNVGALVEDVQDGERGARRLAMEELVPLFWDSPDLASAIGRSGEYRERGLADTALPTREIRLPNVPGLTNRLLLRRAWVASSIRSIERLQADLEEALRLLESEMETE
jgi:hypothetical protein